MLISVNVALPSPLDTAKGRVPSAIRKRAVDARVKVRALGLDGDAQADLEHHGGLEQAVYAYTLEHAEAWARELGDPPYPHGSFGENLTVTELFETEVRIGDVFRIGTARIEVTKPRSPCYKLAAVMGRPDFAKRFLESGRTGFYCRVLEEGEVGAGDAVVLEHREAGGLTVWEDARRRWMKG